MSSIRLDPPQVVSPRLERSAASLRVLRGSRAQSPPQSPPRAISSPRVLTPRRLQSSHSQVLPGGYAYSAANAQVPVWAVRRAEDPEYASCRMLEPPVTLYRETLDCFIRSMQAELAELRLAVYEERESRNPRKWSVHAERDARKAVDQKLDHLSSELQHCKRRFVSYHSLPTGDLRKALDKIEGRGNIQVDISSEPGQVHLIRPLLFQRRTAGDPPTADFSQPDLAQNICDDLAEVAKLFDCSVTVEGHTKGGEGEFWQALANNRARLVAEKLVSLGIDADKISCQGRPGKLGLNNSCTVVRLGIPSMSHQPVQSWPQGVLVETQPLVETVAQPVYVEGLISPGGPVYVETSQSTVLETAPRLLSESFTSSPSVSRSVSLAMMNQRGSFSEAGASPRLSRSISRTKVT